MELLGGLLLGGLLFGGKSCHCKPCVKAQKKADKEWAKQRLSMWTGQQVQVEAHPRQGIPTNTTDSQ